MCRILAPETGQILNWTAPDGTDVQAKQEICTMTVKSGETQSIKSPAAGKLQIESNFVKPGPATKGELLARVRRPSLIDPWRNFYHWLNPNAQHRDHLLFAIGSAAFVWYLACITLIAFEKVTPSNLKHAGDSTKQVSDGKTADELAIMDMYQFMSFSITTISGTLATYMGMVLGLNRRTPTSSPDRVTRVQKMAAWAYLASLLYALLLWLIHVLGTWEGGDDKTIIILGTSILGLFGGALAVILNTDPSPAT